MRRHEPSRRAPFAPALAAAALALAVLALLAPTAAGADDDVRVRYRTADTVYLDAGEAAGLAEGDRLEVFRDGERIAVVEVIFVATHSASCRVIEEGPAVEAGDAARPLGAAEEEAPAADSEAAPGAAPAEPEPETRYGAVQEEEEERRRPLRRRPETRVGGTLSFDFEQFSDGSDEGLDFQRTNARLDLRLRDVGGYPLDVRLRTRTRRLTRERGLGIAPETETRDRFYEASVSWEPPEGRFSLQLGRLRPGFGIGAGYLDGAVGEMRLGNAWHVGAFAGTRSEIDGYSLDTSRQKVGLFTRWSPDRGDGWRPLDIFVAGVREDGEIDVSREFVALEVRWTGQGVWSLYQRAEIDVNSGWRQELDDAPSSQLSQLALTAVGRFSDRVRLVVTYDRFERYRDEDSRFIPEELFDAALRQGLRARLQLGDPRGLTFSLNGGWRDRDGDEESAWHGGLGIAHGDLFGLRVAADASLFSNRFSEGAYGTLRLSKRIAGLHFVDLTLGGRQSSRRLLTEFFGDEDLVTTWVRLGGWFELPLRLFLRGEVEWTGGDELEGQRFTLGIGYRF